MIKNCFVCNHKFNKVGNINGQTILKCGNCGLGITEKQTFQIGDYHRDETYIREEELFKNIFKKRVDIIGEFKRKGKVLEVGCSTGILLSLFKDEGWKVKGVEISETAALAAKHRGIDVTVEPFQRLKLEEKFDLIIFNHTLEHLQYPKKVLEKARSMLNKNGLIYIDLPNYGGASANILGLKWPLLLPEEHRWHFTSKALKLLLKGLGFKILFIEKASGVWDYANPLKGILISLINFKKRFFIEVVTAVPSWIVSRLGVGSDLLLIARKI